MKQEIKKWVTIGLIVATIYYLAKEAYKLFKKEK